MPKQYSLYKGLQKPLVYKGFKGKFIYWGVGCLLAGLVLGALAMAVINKWVGALTLVGIIVGGLYYTANKQKQGLYSKTKSKGVYIYPANLKNIYRYGKKNRI